MGLRRPQGLMIYLSVIFIIIIRAYLEIQPSVWRTVLREKFGAGIRKVDQSFYLLARATSHCKTASKFVSSFALIP